ncbi:MAG: hypothetical protein J2P17_01690, partial [Mycobacterium sp.]|nr:hypothetical protein [Mycobacterium sp.]
QFVNAEDQVVRIRPPKTVFEVVRAHREVSAELGDGPWWRLLVRLTPGGEPEIGQDYGEEPFPPDQLFPAEAYAEDLETYPRDRLPVWLAAHIGHGDRQVRTPRDAAIDVIVGGPAAVLSEADFPPLTLLWARWAVISAAFVAIQSQLGPRVQPSLGWFEGSRRSGSTLFILPDGRAVLSGGVWNAPALDAAYNGGTELPDLYAGAPDWVADPVLDHRANKGLLSFCYWWDGSDWYKGDSPAAEHLSAAVPGIWTADTTVDVISALIDEDPDDEVRTAVADLVSAAEAGIVTRANLTEAFGDGEYWDLDEDDDEDLDFYDGEDRDLDGAFMQLTMAGLTITTPEEPMPEEEAIARVRDYILENNIDTTGYPLENLRADRLDVGWMVYVPTRPGEIAIGRAIFYIADDGVLEPSSSSIAPSRYIEAFEQRFHTRHGTVPA